jgi:hypothetical protein
MCGQERDELLYTMCKNGHHIHAECLGALVRSTYPEHPPCPICRDQSLCALVMSVMPDLVYMELTPFSQTAAVVSMVIGSSEYSELHGSSAN